MNGKLTASGDEPQDKPGDKKQAKAEIPKTPGEKEADRWLEMIDDQNKEIRDQQIQKTIGRVREPEQDW